MNLFFYEGRIFLTMNEIRPSRKINSSLVKKKICSSWKKGGYIKSVEFSENFVQKNAEKKSTDVCSTSAHAAEVPAQPGEGELALRRAQADLPALASSILQGHNAPLQAM